jgi:hypothetical protein
MAINRDYVDSSESSTELANEDPNIGKKTSAKDSKREEKSAIKSKDKSISQESVVNKSISQESVVNKSISQESVVNNKDKSISQESVVNNKDKSISQESVVNNKDKSISQESVVNNKDKSISQESVVNNKDKSISQESVVNNKDKSISQESVVRRRTDKLPSVSTSPPRPQEVFPKDDNHTNIRMEADSDALVTKSVAEAVEKTVGEVVENVTDLSESKSTNNHEVYAHNLFLSAVNFWQTSVMSYLDIYKELSINTIRLTQNWISCFFPNLYPWLRLNQ